MKPRALVAAALLILVGAYVLCNSSYNSSNRIFVSWSTTRTVTSGQTQLLPFELGRGLDANTSSTREDDIKRLIPPTTAPLPESASVRPSPAPGSAGSRLMDILTNPQPTEAFRRYAEVHKAERAKAAEGLPSRVVEYSCDEWDACGGTGNRLHGVVNAFVLAMLTDSAFVINWPKGSFQSFVEPAMENLDWRPTSSFWGPSIDISVVDGPTTASEWYGRLFREDVVAFLGQYNHIQVHATTMWAHEVLNNPHVQEKARAVGLAEPHAAGTLQRAILTFLMRPKPIVLDALDHFDAHLHEKLGPAGVDRGLFLVGVQVRTGGDGQWSDPKRVPMDVVHLYTSQAMAFARNHTNVNTTAVVFLTSDSAKALSIMRKHLDDNGVPWITSDGFAGDITHSERSSFVQPNQLPDNEVRAAVAMQLRGWVDFFLLAVMDALVHTRSSFSEMAASLSCRPSVYFNSHGYIQGDFLAPPFQAAHGFCDFWASTMVANNYYV